MLHSSSSFSGFFSKLVAFTSSPLDLSTSFALRKEMEQKEIFSVIKEDVRLLINFFLLKNFLNLEWILQKKVFKKCIFILINALN